MTLIKNKTVDMPQPILVAVPMVRPEPILVVEPMVRPEPILVPKTTILRTAKYIITKQPKKSNPTLENKTITTLTKILCCACYRLPIIDARCCGVCYFCCPVKPDAHQCNVCPNTFDVYWNSGYVQTEAGYGPPQPNGFCCWLCFPLKITLFFPCCLGAICNNCINYMRDTEVNYLF